MVFNFNVKHNNKIFLALIAFLVIAFIGSAHSSDAPQMDSDGYYLIKTKEDLEWLRDYVNNGYFLTNAKLASNIELAGSEDYQWTPIGSSGSHYYSGIFDGNGYKVTGLYMNNSTSQCKMPYGLFGVVKNATIKNLTVSGNLAVYEDTIPVGGICGSVDNSTISNCVNEVNITGTFRAGGICGNVVDSTVSNNVNKGNIAGGMTGGICAYAANGTVIIKNCINEGDVIVSETSYGAYAGGICAEAYGGAKITITNCVNKGDMTGTKSVGGIFGGVSPSVSTTTITNCMNEGHITSSLLNAPHIGGIVGDVWIHSDNAAMTIENCVNKGELDAQAGGSLGGMGYLGGICGHIKAQTNSSVEITNCVNEGAVTGEKNSLLGGILCGLIQEDATVKISNCVNAGYIVGQSNSRRAIICDYGIGDGSKVELINSGYLSGTAPSAGLSSAVVYTVSNLPTAAAIQSLTNVVQSGESFTPAVNVYPAVAYNAEDITKTVKLKSDSDNIYIADNEIYAIKEGIAIITATVSGLLGNRNLELVQEIAVMGPETEYITKITLSKTESKIYIGDTAQLSATLSPENPTVSYLEWTSSNPNVATVDSTGKVTAVSEGTAIITARAIDGSNQFANCTVNVKKAINLSLNKGQTTIRQGATETLTLTNTASSDELGVEWSSSNPSVATVDQNGKITAVSRGSAVITVKSKVIPEKTASCSVTVKDPVIAEMSENTSVIKDGTQLSVNVSSWDEDDVLEWVWSSSNKSIATVDETGKVTGFSGGDVTITATLKNDPNIKYTCSVTVNAMPARDTENNYLIGSRVELDWFRNAVNGGSVSLNAKLTADIDLAGSEEKQWIPIGSSSKKYSGTFDGNGHRITGLYINNSADYQGLFGYIYSGAVIKNITVTGKINAHNYAGGICGYAYNYNSYNNITICNCVSEVDVTAYNFAGGICGYAYNYYGNDNVTISNCVNEGTVKATSSSGYAGGICGEAQNYDSNTTVSVSNCINCGTVNGNYAGGICGYAYNQGNYTNEVIKLTSCGYLKGTASSSIGYRSNSYGSITDNSVVYEANQLPSAAGMLSCPATVSAGMEIQPVLDIYPVNAYNKNSVRYEIIESSDESVIATYNNKAYAVGTGNATLTVKVAGLLGNSEVTFEKEINVTGNIEQYVEGIALNKTVIEKLYTGSSEQLTATINPANATIGFLKWTSNNPNVATVDATGKVTAVSEGTATVTAQAIDGSNQFASCTVNVKKAINLSLDKEQTKIRLGAAETLTLTNTASSDEQGIEWSSSNLSVATVDPNGRITAISKGSATITVKSTVDTAKSASCDVTVLETISVSLDKTEAVVRADGTLTLTPTVEKDESDSGKLTWSSSNPSVVSVNSSTGAIMIQREGIAKITATSQDDTTQSASCNVTVKKSATVSFSQEMPSTIATRSSGIDISQYISFSGDTSDTGKITWSSSDIAVATVDTEGIVSVKKAGRVTITATSKDDPTKSVSKMLNITQSVTGITITAQSGGTQLPAKETKQLTVTITPSNAENKKVVWTSSNTNVATVDQNGLVTAKEITGASANVTITAEAQDGSGVKGTIQLTVTRIPVENIVILPETGDDTILVNGMKQLLANIMPSNATNKDIMWTSSNSGIVAVDQNGLVTAKEITGTSANVTITASALDGSGVKGTLQLTVMRPPVTSISFSQAAYTLEDDSSTVDLYGQLSIQPEMALKPSKGEITWTSNNANIAINSNGVVSAAGSSSEAQTATITAKYVNDKGTQITGTTIVSTKSKKISLILLTTLAGRSSGGKTGSNIENIEVCVYNTANRLLYSGQGTTDENGKLTLEMDAGSVSNGQKVKLWIKGERYLAAIQNATVQLNGSDWNVTMAETIKGGDANGDNSVNLTDFGILGKSFLKKAGVTGYDARADFNADNSVNLTDFGILGTSFLKKGEAKPKAAVTMLMRAVNRNGTTDNALKVLNIETAEVADKALEENADEPEEKQEEAIIEAVEQETGVTLKAASPTVSNETGSNSNSSSGGCNAGFGILALLCAAPMIFRKKQ